MSDDTSSATKVSTVDIPKDLYDTYKKEGQEHVFRFVKNGICTDADAKGLFAQLADIDVSRVNRLYRSSMDSRNHSSNAQSKLEPVKTVQVLANAKTDDVESWARGGLTAIAKGTVAVIIMAGGQGTRLGFDRPKGEYNIKLPSGKTLFQLQAERIIKLERLATKYGKDPRIQLYLMTSPMTHGPTVEAWKRENNYGLKKDQVFIFQQGTLPCLTVEGKIMLEASGKVAMAPDGNGGIYLGLHKSGAVKHMKDNGIRSIFVGAIDNAVSRVADPTFIGYCLSKRADVGNKVCTKCGPHEKVGVQCLRDGVPAVVEYSDIDPKIAEMRDASGNLVFSAGNVCIHYYSIDFVEKTCAPSKLSEEFHIANKKIPYADETGRTVQKSELKANTGIKLESFIFDIFSESKNLVVFEVARSDEFSPVKNAPGSKADSPDTARAIISSLHKSWLGRAGVSITASSNSLHTGQDANLCEVSPLVSYGGEGLESLRGMSISTPCLIQLASESIDGAKYERTRVLDNGICVYTAKGPSQGCEMSGCSML